MPQNKAPRNRTITLSASESSYFRTKLLKLDSSASLDNLKNRTICQDLFEAADYLPSKFADILFLDPPYNLGRSFNTKKFKEMPLEDYEEYIESFVLKLQHTLKPNATIYFCGDWRSSTAIHRVLEKYFIVRNRITWEREKGRGSKTNWKNNSEDIWFATVGKNYTFNIDDVKLKRKVIAPYRTESGKPKDWHETKEGSYRITHPSNLWTDISVPFWSMPENTDHPTQKPEKLMAKLILASSNEGDLIFDPFAGSGTTSVTAKKLNRNYLNIELDESYASLIEKRLEIAEDNKTIQGYSDGVFWERNTHKQQLARNNGNLKS